MNNALELMIEGINKHTSKHKINEYIQNVRKLYPNHNIIMSILIENDDSITTAYDKIEYKDIFCYTEFVNRIRNINGIDYIMYSDSRFNGLLHVVELDYIKNKVLNTIGINKEHELVECTSSCKLIGINSEKER